MVVKGRWLRVAKGELHGGSQTFATHDIKIPGVEPEIFEEN